jgi:hypothetical protein
MGESPRAHPRSRVESGPSIVTVDAIPALISPLAFLVVGVVVTVLVVGAIGRWLQRAGRAYERRHRDRSE